MVLFFLSESNPLCWASIRFIEAVPSGVAFLHSVRGFESTLQPPGAAACTSPQTGTYLYPVPRRDGMQTNPPHGRCSAPVPFGTAFLHPAGCQNLRSVFRGSEVFSLAQHVLVVLPVVGALDAVGIGAIGGQLALAALPLVVAQGGDGGLGKEDDDGDVDDDHEGLQEVGSVPREARGDDRARKDQGGGAQAVDDHEDLARLLLHDEAQAALGVVVVAEEGGEGEEADGHRDEDRAEAAEGSAGAGLDIGGARCLGAGLHAGEEAEEGGGRADEQGVDEDGEHLHKALLCRVAHVGRGRRVGGRAHTGLVGVQAALDAPHDAGAGEAAEDGLEVKSGLENVFEHRAEVGDMPKDHDEGDDHVQHAHHGHEDLGDLGESFSAAEDADAEQHRENAADDHRHIHSETGDLKRLFIEAEALEGALGVVGREHVVAHHVGEDQDDGEDHAQPALAQALLHVVGGAAVAVALAVALLVDLGEGGLHKRGGAAEDRRDPHPEDRARAAEADSRRDTHDVAGADA